MAHVIAQTGLVASFDNRPAMATGVLGTVLVGALSLLAAAMPGAPEPDDGLDELPFTPAFIMALGSPEADAFMEQPSPSPPSEPTEPTEPVEPTDTDVDDTEPDPDDAVTDDPVPPQPPQPPRPPKPAPPRPPKPTPPTAGPPKPLPSPPSPGSPSKGDPFGSPGGFDDLNESGDPWARAILAALDGMDVGTAYGRPIAGNVRFEITVCKDGRISRVANKGGSAGPDERDLVLLEVGRLSIPRPPPAIAASMKSSCAKLRHTFSWTTRGTK